MDIKQKRRYIYSLGRKCGLVDDGNKSDDLHGFVYQLTLKESISELNDEQVGISLYKKAFFAVKIVYTADFTTFYGC